MFNIFKKIGCVLLCAILLFSLLSIVGLAEKKAQQPIASITKDQLTAKKLIPELISGKEGCEFCTADVVCGACMQENIRPFTVIPLSDINFSTLTIVLNEKVPENTFFYLYYATDASEESFDPAACLIGSTIAGTDLLVINGMPPEGVDTLYFDGVAAYTIKSISFYDIVIDGVSLSFNYVAAIVFLVTLILSLILAFKFHFFDWLVCSIKEEFSYTKELFSSASKWRFVLHISRIVCTTAFFLLAATFLTFDLYRHGVLIAIFFVGAAALVLELVDRFVSSRGTQTAKLFLIVALLLGTITVTTIPPRTNTAWDDGIHFRQAYAIASAGHASSLAQHKYFTDAYRYNSYIVSPEYFAKKIVAEDALALSFELPASNPANLLGHLPMAAVFAASRLLSVNLIKTSVLCRLANLLTYITILYFAIKKMKRGGLIFSAVCLLSCPLYLACSFKVDYWMMAWFAYGFATVFSVYQEPDRTFKVSELVMILVSLFLGCSPKMIYFPILLPLLFLHKKRFVNPCYQKRFRIAVIGTAALLLLLVLVPGLFNNFYADVRASGNISSWGQIAFILKNPFTYLRIFFSFFGEIFSIGIFHTWNTMFSYGYLSLSSATGAWQGTLAFFMLLFAICIDRTENDLYDSREHSILRFTSLGACFITVLFIVTSMYVAFTPVAYNGISGVQFRYLYPLFLPIFYALTPKNMHIGGNKKIQSFILFAGLSANYALGFLQSYISVLMHF